LIKGWSGEVIARLNALLDQVIADRARNPNFERKWLEARKSAQEEEGITEKKRKRQPAQACSQACLERLESDDDNDIAPAASGAPVEDSGSETDEETD
jgi:hypothetical protein